MPYIIDGHNLIGQMAAIRLDDPDDEAKLVMVLQRFAMRRQVAVSVVFDRGHFGKQRLGGGGVQVRFARSSSDADALIKAFLRHVARPGDWVLVTSDREIVAVAQEVGTRVISAHDFADMLADLDKPAAFDAERAAAHAHVRGDQVDEWLNVFGVDPAVATQAVDLSRKPRKTAPPSAPVAKKPNQRTKSKPAIVVPEPPQRWPEPKKPKARPDPLPREADGRPRRSRGGPRPISSQGEPLHKPPPPVHPDEIDEWLEFFGAAEE